MQTNYAATKKPTPEERAQQAQETAPNMSSALPTRYMERYPNNRNQIIAIKAKFTPQTKVNIGSIAFTSEGIEALKVAATDVASTLFHDVYIEEPEKAKYLHNEWHIVNDELYLHTFIPMYESYSIAHFPKTHWRDRLELEEDICGTA